MDTIYLDNAATSFPKPEGVAEAMVRYLTEVGEREWLVDGRYSIDDAIELGWPIEDNAEYETIAGFVLELADRLPRSGDSFEKDGYTFYVQSMRARRVSMIRVTAPEEREPEEEPRHGLAGALLGVRDTVSGSVQEPEASKDK